MSGAGAVWVLNLDAEEELAQWPRPYTPPRRTAAWARAIEAARVLFAPGDRLIDEFGVGEAAGRTGRAWCPTPRALAALDRAGALAPPSPRVEVLVRVLDRTSVYELGAPLEGAFVARNDADLAYAREHACGGEPSRAWIAKRPFTSSGRGTRVFRGGFDAATEADRAWLRAGTARGPLEIVPFVDVTLELARHGYVDERGGLTVGRTCIQDVDDSRAWVATRVAHVRELPAGVDDALGTEVERVGAWLFACGYIGPFGLDALLYRHRDGPRLCARSEVNARYSMGFAVGIGRVERVARAGD